MLDLTIETRAAAPLSLIWGDWNDRPPFRSWDRCLELRRADTPFGPYLLLRRHAPYRDERTVLVGKWFVQRPAEAPLGPFDDDVQAARAAQTDYAERARALLAPATTDPELARLRAENRRLREENVRLGRAFHHAIGSPRGVVPAGFEDLYEAERTND